MIGGVIGVIAFPASSQVRSLPHRLESGHAELRMRSGCGRLSAPLLPVCMVAGACTKLEYALS